VGIEFKTQYKMNTLELQHSLIRQIIDIQDINLLEYLNKILNTAKAEKVYEVKGIERKLIFESLADIANNKVISNEEVFKKTEAWLNE